MKKLIAILMTLCLMATTVALAGAEAAAPKLSDMPLVVSADDVELTVADFEGSWKPGKIFYGQTYVTPEEAIYGGAMIHPFRIADGKMYMDIEDENGEVQTAEMEITVDANQIQGTDGSGLDFVIEKLTDGNISLSVFVPGENDTLNCLTIFMVPADA